LREKRRNVLMVGSPEGKRPLGRTKCRRVENIKIDLGERGWGGVAWIGLAQDRAPLKVVMKFRFHNML
jgi:hypothetical protein